MKPTVGAQLLIATLAVTVPPFGSARASDAEADAPPPAHESDSAREKRFAAWRATYTEDVVDRVVDETRKLVDAYRARVANGAGEAPTAAPTILRTADTGAMLWDCATCPQMVIVPAGSFTIGSPPDEPGRTADEGPQRRILLAYPFAVSRFEITRGEYEAFVRATGRPVLGGCLTDRAKMGEWAPEPNTTLRDPGFEQQDNHPVLCVNWDDAQAYVAWLNAQSGGGYRLLSEAEWEYVARAGTTATFPWGPSADDGCADANLGDATMHDKYARVLSDYPLAACRDGALNTAPVGSYRANAFGLHDLIANTGEWVEDCATMSYDTLPADGSADVGGDCSRRIVRSGSWGSQIKDTRVANRTRYPVSHVDDSIGIRVAKTLE